MSTLKRPFLAAFSLVLAAVSVAAIGTASTPIAGAAVVQEPTLSSPADASTLSSFGPTLQWTLPSGSTQHHLQVTPSGNDGPGVNIIADAAGLFAIPAPPDWYGLLPDMTYSWRVRATDATTSVNETNASWGPWSAQFTFRTPAPSSSAVTPFSPANGAVVASLTPVLTWSSNTDDLYYFEVQVSKDAQFRNTAFLYSELRHGGVTNPVNSYTIPSAFPLEAGTTYYWRVRPRVQGNGTPVSWGAAASFRTPTAGSIFLNITAPVDNSTQSSATLSVTGKTKAGALVTLDAVFVVAGSDGSFTLRITLDPGANSLDITATDLSSGDTVGATIVVTYAP